MFYENTRKKCRSNNYKNCASVESNTRYRDLNNNNNFYIARDEEQVITAINNVNSAYKAECYKASSSDICDESADCNLEGIENYRNLDGNAVIDTFKYIFDKFKKGIYIKIRNNKLELFLPFSNIYYRNEWSSKINFSDTNSSDAIEKWLREEFYSLTKYNFSKDKDSLNITEWYANNCLLRYDKSGSYINDRDTNIPTIYDMLVCLCQKTKVPDIEFFLNKRDFPILKTNLTEPYNHIWDSNNHPLVSHKYEKYCPIVSMSKTLEYSDILFPTYEDWARVRSKDNIKFPHGSQKYNDDVNINWEDKIEIAIFRGTSTGAGITSNSNNEILFNPRLKARILSKQYPDYLNAGITSKSNNNQWNRRPKKLQGFSKLQIIKEGKIIKNFVDIITLKYSVNEDVSKVDIIEFLKSQNIQFSDESLIKCDTVKIQELVNMYHNNSDVFVPIDVNVKSDLDLIDDVADHINFENQCKYKYILNIDGHTAAQRLSLELSSNSVILKVNSPWKLWYSHMLNGFDIKNIKDTENIDAHYIIIDSNMDNLIDVIKWCRDNDKICKKIANNARKFYDKYLFDKKFMLEYMSKMLYSLKKVTNSYMHTNKSIFDIQIEHEENQQLNYKYPVIKSIQIGKSINLSKYSYTIQGLKSVNWLFDKFASENPEIMFNYKNPNYEKIICINKLGIVYKYNFKNIMLVFKETNLDFENKSKEHIHDSFVGTKCINELLEECPNFTYTFGCYLVNKKFPNILNNPFYANKACNKLKLTSEDFNKDKLTYITVNRFIAGQTFSDYLYNTRVENEFNFQDYISILLQISLSLEIGQRKCGLVHNDLMPWNIIVKKEQNNKNISYVIGTKTYVIKTKIIPYIIDFGKSNVVYNNIKYGYGINIYKTKISKFNDIFMLLSSTINIVLENHLKNMSKNDISQIITLCNFITQTKFKQCKFDTIEDVINFFKQYKKYSILMYSKKLDLDEKSPIDFCNYIHKNFNPVKLKVINNFDKNLYITSELSKTELQLNYKKNELLLFNEIVESFNNYNIDSNYNILLNFLKKITKISLQKSDNIITKYYCAQVLLYNYILTNNKLFNIIKNYKPDVFEQKSSELVEYQNEFMKNLEYIKDYDIKNIENNLEMPLDTSKIDYPNYTEYTFLNLDNIYNLINKFSLNFNNNLSYKNILNKILLFQHKSVLNFNSKLNPNKYIINCEFPKEIRICLKDKFKTILDVDSIKTIENASWCKTLYYMALKLYSNDNLVEINDTQTHEEFKQKISKIFEILDTQII